jgi:aspartate ammonia-lyase
MAEKRKRATFFNNLLSDMERQRDEKRLERERLKRKRQNMRNAEAARIALETHRAKKKRMENAKAVAEQKAMMRQINTYGTMIGKGVLAEKMYKRMLEKVMRQTTYTPTDFKYLGKVVRARQEKRWSVVERLIREWEADVKRRVCRMKKKDMQNIAKGLNVNAGKKKKAQLCQAIKNKM